MALIKCEECKNEISDKATICPNCGCPIEKKIYCEECGEQVNVNDEMCKKCGCPINLKNNNTTPKNINNMVNDKIKNIDISKIKKNIKNNKKIVIIGSIVFVVFLMMIAPNFKHIFKPKISVKATTMREYLDILEIYGRDIDFDGIESGANCLTGTQTKTIQSSKYGTVTVEFSYCKSSGSIYMYVHN